jgi:hypothetical protein
MRGKLFILPLFLSLASCATRPPVPHRPLPSPKGKEARTVTVASYVPAFIRNGTLMWDTTNRVCVVMTTMDLSQPWQLLGCTTNANQWKISMTNPASFYRVGVCP